MTENKTHRVLTDDEKAALLDPDLINNFTQDFKDFSDETAHLVHEFTHIGDSKEHDPLRVRIGFETIEVARANVGAVREFIEHPDVPDDLREARWKILMAMAIAGQVALDLRQAELRWDQVVANYSGTASQNPLVALISFLDAALPKDEK